MDTINLLNTFILLIVVGLISKFWKSMQIYFDEKAKNLVKKEDFNMLLDQLKMQTKETELIKSSIAHSDWAERESKTLIRNKLEVFFLAVDESVDELCDFDTSILDFKPMYSLTKGRTKISMISNLYLPELKAEVIEYLTFYIQSRKIMLETSSLISNKATDLEKMSVIVLRRDLTLNSLEDVYHSADKLRDKCSQLMQNLISASS